MNEFVLAIVSLSIALLGSLIAAYSAFYAAKKRKKKVERQALREQASRNAQPQVVRGGVIGERPRVLTVHAGHKVVHAQPLEETNIDDGHIIGVSKANRVEKPSQKDKPLVPLR